jgi:hypothetical protein
MKELVHIGISEVTVVSGKYLKRKLRYTSRVSICQRGLGIGREFVICIYRQRQSPWIPSYVGIQAVSVGSIEKWPFTVVPVVQLKLE